jgi:hypothetical protein
MSDYTQTVFFGPKDALTTGDPNKRIEGTEVDVELDAISDAIVTKYDSADIASQAQARTGTSNSVLMTPLRVADAMQNGEFAGATQRKVKTADTLRASTITLADDPHLFGFTLVAGKRYALRGALRLTAGSVPQMKLRLDFSQLPASGAFGSLVQSLAATSTPYGVRTDTWNSSDLQTSASGAVGIAHIEAFFRANVSTGGVVDLQWAQVVSDATNITIFEGSYLELVQLD